MNDREEIARLKELLDSTTAQLERTQDDREGWKRLVVVLTHEKYAALYEVDCLRKSRHEWKRRWAEVERRTRKMDKDALLGRLAMIKDCVEQSYEACLEAKTADTLRPWLAAFKRDYLDAEVPKVIRCGPVEDNGWDEWFSRSLIIHDFGHNAELLLAYDDDEGNPSGINAGDEILLIIKEKP